MLGVGILGDIDNGEKLLDFASGVAKLTVTVVLLVVPLSCLDGQLIDLEHQLLSLAVERLAIGHEGQPKLLERGRFSASRGHELNERRELALGLCCEVGRHPAAVVGQEGALSARATAGDQTRRAVDSPGASYNAG